MTDAFRRRRRRPFGSLEAVRIRLRWAYPDQAIAIRHSIDPFGNDTRYFSIERFGPYSGPVKSRAFRKYFTEVFLT